MFKEIIKLASKVKLIKGSLTQGNPEFTFMLNDIECVFSIDSHVNLAGPQPYQSISIVLRAVEENVILWACSVYDNNILGLLELLTVLEKRSESNRSEMVKRVAKLTGVFN